jgi:16S rRNA (guanine966-N2)-methyltransferase
VSAVLAAPAERAYDVVLVDPPYDVPAAEVAGWLSAAAAHGWLADDATVVVERASREGRFPWPEALRAVRERRYGETTLHVALRYGPGL